MGRKHLTQILKFFFTEELFTVDMMPEINNS